MSTENVPTTSVQIPSDSSQPYLHFVKYEKNIYVLALFGGISQILIVAVIIAHLCTNWASIDYLAEVTAALAMVTLACTAFSEILLMRAVNQRLLRYIQWWMTSSFIGFLFATLMTAISGFTLYNERLWWIALAFGYLVLRLPFQIHFVDEFTHAEMVHKEPHSTDINKRILYRRFT